MGESKRTSARTADHHALQQAWLDCARVLAPQVDESLLRAESDLLLRAWDAPGRAYHCTQHLAEMVEAIDILADETGLRDHDRQIAQAATWYHDLTYDPRAEAGSNEHRSATQARDHLHRLGVDDADVDAVEACILATADHQLDAASPVCAPVLLDADLWILASPPERYAQYRQQVREEYAFVPAELFARGRRAVLTGFANRAHIYVTDAARRLWEPKARHNLAAEIADLDEAVDNASE